MWRVVVEFFFFFFFWVVFFFFFFLVGVGGCGFVRWWLSVLLRQWFFGGHCCGSDGCALLLVCKCV